MDLQLKRSDYLETGIFGVIASEDYLVGVTLEHAYPFNNGFLPKIPPGTFTCVRGVHRLEGMTQDFETFEITGVKGHTNLLFHSGNVNDDSSGCILLGMAVVDKKMIINSRICFTKFMRYQGGVDSFSLTVIA